MSLEPEPLNPAVPAQFYPKPVWPPAPNGTWWEPKPWGGRLEPSSPSLTDGILGDVPSRALQGVTMLTAERGPNVYITCLGKFQIYVDNSPLTAWKSSKSRTLLQYLINHRDRPIPRDTLVDALWPDPNAAAPTTSLKVAVHGLRTTLAAFNTSIPLTIIAHNSSYSLETYQLWLDVEEFEYCYRLGKALFARKQNEEALALFDRAAELYTGDFLEEVPDEWPVFRREGLKDQYLYVTTELAKSALSSEDYQAGILRSQQILAKDHCREDAYRMLITCHSRLGQRGRVRGWYDLCVHSLQAELDCGPAPETEEVYRLALAGKI